MRSFTVDDITKGLSQDDMTDYLERFQFSNNPMWLEWIESQSVYNVVFESGKDSREFEDDIKVIGIPLPLVDILARIDSLRFINNNPVILEKTKIENEESITELENQLWGLSYRYNFEQYGKEDIYLFWVWSNGYFNGIYKGKKYNIIND